jgi:Cof subfamily protein (haloacid dehalogenase superfamily)
LCSGRPAFGLALEYARQLDSEGWHIFQNGASVLNFTSHESRSIPLPGSVVSELIAQARATNKILELYSDSAYVVESEAAWAREHAELLGVPFQAQRFETLEKPVVRAQWVVSPAEAALIIAPPGLEMAESTSPLMPDARFVGMTREGVSKGTAMRQIAAAYQVDMRDVMYVGDSGNDLPALQVVGHPVAMGNSGAEVRKAAKRIVGHVDQGGLAEALLLAVSGA